VGILEPSPRREAIVGVLLTPAVAMAATAAPAAAGSSSTASLAPPAAAAAAALASGAYEGCLMLVPIDPRLPKGLLAPGAVAELPEELRYDACLIWGKKRNQISCCCPAVSSLLLLCRIA
jgi:hypothetical protein